MCQRALLRDITDLGYVKGGLANLASLVTSNAQCKLAYTCSFSPLDIINMAVINNKGPLGRIPQTCFFLSVSIIE